MLVTAPSGSTSKVLVNFSPIVVDNFLNSSEFLMLSEEFNYMPMHLCNWSDSNNIKLFFGVRKSNKPTHLECLASTISLKTKKYIKRKFNFKRIHLNGQVYGQEGQFHQDSKESMDISVLIFTNKEWNPAWGGQFSFVELPDQEVQTVTYKPNRAVIFPSTLYHCGNSPLRYTDRLRTSAVFLFETYEHRNFHTSL